MQLDLLTMLEVGRGYPLTPGFKDRTTSQDAAVKMLETGAAKHYRQKVLESLTNGPGTAKQIADRIGASLDNTRPRLTGLKLEGLVTWTGEKVNGQQVWMLVNKQ